MKNGQPQRSNVRLFMQLLAFGGCADVRAAHRGAGSVAALPGVLYEDVNDPRGVALLTFRRGSGVLCRSACGRC